MKSREPGLAICDNACIWRRLMVKILRRIARYVFGTQKLTLRVIWSTVSPVELRPDVYVGLIAGAFRRGAAPEQPTMRWIITFRREHDQPFGLDATMVSTLETSNPPDCMWPRKRPWMRQRAVEVKVSSGWQHRRDNQDDHRAGDHAWRSTNDDAGNRRFA